MKKLIVVIALAALSSYSRAQSAETKPRELGLRFSGINFNGNNNFNLVFKKQKANPEKYMRYRFIFADISTGDVASTVSPSFALGAAIGREKRKSINEKFKFIRGWDFSANYNSQFSNYSYDIHRIYLSMGYVVGFQYDINKDFCVNLEALPSISNSLIVADTDLSSSFNFTLNSQGALSVFYKF